tara:strand:- start:1274 stop:1726 length:453 start_codon:yes stop_codon:yes gene_type:complete
MEQYYTKEECSTALKAAEARINELTRFSLTYTRGVNDCFALLVEYDKRLRGSTSVARQHINFEWETTKDFVVKLHKVGFTVEQYLEFLGYEIVSNRRPLIGDVAFEQGGIIIAGPRGWVSTLETNRGAAIKRPMTYLERHLKIIARPLRN